MRFLLKIHVTKTLGKSCPVPMKRVPVGVINEKIIDC